MITPSSLAHFTGTEHYYKEMYGLKITDGVKYFRDEGQCGWLISDIAALVAFEAKIQVNSLTNSFLLVELKINRKEKKATLSFREDSDKPALYSQTYEYTDLPNYYSEESITFYLIDGVLMLRSEY